MVDDFEGHGENPDTAYFAGNYKGDGVLWGWRGRGRDILCGVEPPIPEYSHAPD
jgi:hypothetical protein